MTHDEIPGYTLVKKSGHPTDIITAVESNQQPQNHAPRADSHLFQRQQVNNHEYYSKMVKRELKEMTQWLSGYPTFKFDVFKELMIIFGYATSQDI